MSGMSRHTGQPVNEADHLRQSIVDILTTPIGSRVMRRDYGSDLPDLIDKPMTPALKLDIFTATVKALTKWEPRLEIQRVFVLTASAGTFVLGIIGIDSTGQTIDLRGISL